MKYRLLILLITLLIFKAHAQTPVNTTKAFSIGAELAIPTFGIYSIGTGVSAKLEIPVAGQFSISGTGGFTAVFYKSNFLSNSASPGADMFAPLKLGVKYYFIQNVYAEGEAGTAIELNHNKQDLFAFSIGPGFVIPAGKNAVDVSFRYEDWQGQLRQTAIRFAYRFGW
jgi:hypothetical protein